MRLTEYYESLEYDEFEKTSEEAGQYASGQLMGIGFLDELEKNAVNFGKLLRPGAVGRIAGKISTGIGHVTGGNFKRAQSGAIKAMQTANPKSRMWGKGADAAQAINKKWGAKSAKLIGQRRAARVGAGVVGGTALVGGASMMGGGGRQRRY